MELSRNNSPSIFFSIALIGICFILISGTFFPLMDLKREKPESVSSLIPTPFEDREPSQSVSRYENSFTEDFKSFEYTDKKNTTTPVGTSNAMAMFRSKALTPKFVGNYQLNVRSHGGGYMPYFDEYWYPHWSNNNIYRFNREFQEIGSFSISRSEIMQVWGDVDGSYYTAHWGHHVFEKRDKDHNLLWTTINIGYEAGGVCVDDQYVYGQKYHYNQLYVFDKETGSHVKTMTIPNSPYCHGGLTYANGLIYMDRWSNDCRRIGITDAETMAYQGEFSTQECAYTLSFDGENYCTSPSSGTVYKYKICDGNAYMDLLPENYRTFQSLNIHEGDGMIGAVELKPSHTMPAGSSITYSVSTDKINWEEVPLEEEYILENPGTELYWKAVLSASDPEKGPSISKLVIDYDYVSPPDLVRPSEDDWVGDKNPHLQWLFVDADEDDRQSEFLVEIYADEDMEEKIYDSDWVDSRDSEHVVEKDLEDGYYWWRVSTKDSFGAQSIFSKLRLMKVDITKPRGSIIIEKNAVSVSEKWVNVAFNSTDDASGISQMQIISADGSYGLWEEFKSEKLLALTFSHGLKTLGVRYKDNAGIISDEYFDEIFFDMQGPSAMRVYSITHPDPSRYYGSDEPVFNWEIPEDISGIMGYSYTLDPNPASVPDAVTDTAGPGANHTLEGDFRGLTEGTWYFHVAAVDTFNQWGGTSHFPINIDKTPPIFSKLECSGDPWSSSSNVECSVIFSDLKGTGIDIGSIMYSTSLDGSGFGPWKTEGVSTKVIEYDEEGIPVKVSVKVEINFPDGDKNYVRFQASDIGGNLLSSTDELQVLIDTIPVTISDPRPSPEKSSDDVEVFCSINIMDINGSKVKGSTVQYSVSYDGFTSSSFGPWTPVGITQEDTVLSPFIWHTFPPGKDNYIKWRAQDVAGTGYAISSPYRVWVNSGPDVKITLPENNSVHQVENYITFDPIGTQDPESDPLQYYWVIKEDQAKYDDKYGYQESFSTRLNPGNYTIYLHVTDDPEAKGHNISSYAKIRVEGEVDDSLIYQDKKSGEEEKTTSDLWWIWTIVIMAIVLVAIGIIIQQDKKKLLNKMEEEEKVILDLEKVEEQKEIAREKKRTEKKAAQKAAAQRAALAPPPLMPQLPAGGAQFPPLQQLGSGPGTPGMMPMLPQGNQFGGGPGTLPPLF